MPVAETDYAALPPKAALARDDRFLVVSAAGTPYRSTFPLPTIDGAGNVEVSALASAAGVKLFAASDGYVSMAGTPDAVGSYHAAIRVGRSGAAGYNSYLAFFTESKGAANTNDTSAEKMRLDDNGQLGIGTAAPAAKLQVALAGTTGGEAIRFGTGNYAMGSLGEDSSNNMVWIWNRYTGGTGQISFCGGSARTEFARFDATGNFLPGTDNSKTIGNGSKRWSTIYAATGTINTSDERAKTDIEAIPDPWLDAWGDVEWLRFKFLDGQRWHLGLVAQRVHAAFAAHGLDAFEIGLCCYDQWEEQREPILRRNGEPSKRTRIVQAAGDRWGLRYDECFAIEAAYQRRRLDRIEARLNAMASPSAEPSAD